MILLIVVLGAYTNSRNPAFLSSFTLNNLLVATMPLALAAMGQTSALMVRAFDVSVGALTTLCLVVASFVLTPDSGWGKLDPRHAAGLARRDGRGLRQRGVDPHSEAVVDHRHARHVQHPVGDLPQVAPPAWWPHQRSLHEWTARPRSGFMPVAFVVIVLVAVAADVWLYRSAGGLAARATGLDEESAKRRGVRVGFLFVRAFFIVAAAAAVSSYFMATNAQIGDPNYGIPYTLTQHLGSRARRCEPPRWTRAASSVPWSAPCSST